MSESKPQLNYEPSQYRPRTTGLFICCLLVWTVLTPAIAMGVVLLVIVLGGSTGAFVAGATAVAAVVGLVVARVRSTGHGPRRTAVLTGTLIGVCIGFLLIGACFAALNGIKL